MRTLAALMLYSSLAFACPNGWPTISDEYNDSVMVLVGKVVAHAATPAEGEFYDGDTYTVVSVRVLKGNLGARIDLFSENSSGRFPMRTNREYLLFVYEQSGRLMVENCGNSDLMPHAKSALAQTIAVAHHGTDSQAALNSLHNANPAVEWNADSSKIADFDCDGIADTVLLGSEKSGAVVGVVWGSPTKHPQILTFAIGTATQDGFTKQPTEIDTVPLDCKAGDGRMLPGCKTTPACRTFVVRDDDTDPFYFYWDSTHATLRWWRQ
jgi:hypothetical protein